MNLDQIRMEKLSETFQVLSDPTRLKIIEYLRDGEQNVSSISKYIEMEQSATSHQLRKLKSLDLVQTRREGRSVYYRLNCDHVLALYDQGLEHVEHTYIDDLKKDL